MREPVPSFLDAFQIRVELVDIEPLIWRRIHVPVAISLETFHDVLQIAFGWQNSHLHDFEVGEVRFGMADVEDELFSVDERGAPLGAVARVGSVFLYRYDFGDDWEHTVTVERFIEGGARTLECLDGARACPPEDSGGTSGYAALLEGLADPQHEEHDDMRRWVGRRFDSEKFDVVAVNKKLATLSKKTNRQLRL
jgi:hypothetical protein